MYSSSSTVRPLAALLFIFFTFLSTSIMGCDGAGSGLTDESNKLKPDFESGALSSTDIEYAHLIPQVNKSGISTFLLQIRLKESSRWRGRLDGLRILSKKNEKPTIIRDDGKNGDAFASDGIYSGYVSNGCVPERTQAAAGKRVEFECTVLFVGPGNVCGDFGECPARVHRSLFWGLIEYDTDIVFCVCLSECTGTYN